MPHIDDLFDSPYLKAGNLQADGDEVTISDIQKQNIGPENKPKPVVYVKEFDRPLILNKTNAKAIIKQFGKETEDWIGEKIYLRRDKTEWQGEIVDCIRVSDEAPKRRAKK